MVEQATENRRVPSSNLGPGIATADQSSLDQGHLGSTYKETCTNIPVSLPEFYRRLSTEAVCTEFIVSQRWGVAPMTLPQGGNLYIKVMGYSRLRLRTWLGTLDLAGSVRKGPATLGLPRSWGPHPEELHGLCNSVSGSMGYGTSTCSQGRAEVDEAYLGSKERNKHRDNKEIRGARVPVASKWWLCQRSATVYTDVHPGYKGPFASEA